MTHGEGFLAWGIATAAAAAQAVDFDAALPAVGDVSSVALLAWYAWHNSTRVIPRLLRDERATAAAARDQFARELARQREAFTAALAEVRAQHLVELGMWHDQLATCQERLRS